MLKKGWSVVQNTVSTSNAEENAGSRRQTNAGNEGTPAEATTTDQKALEPSIHLTNLKAKLQLIRKNGKSNFNLEAMSDLVEEARFNKSAILDDEAAGKELGQLLAMPWPARRCMHLREITELGRKMDFPAGWHGTDRSRCAIWYHSLQRLKLVEFEPGELVIREGELDTCAYWIISGEAVLRSTAAVQAQEKAAAEAAKRADEERLAAEARAAAAAAAAAASATAEKPSSPPPELKTLRSVASRRLKAIGSMKASSAFINNSTGNTSSSSNHTSAFAVDQADLEPDDSPRAKPTPFLSTVGSESIKHKLSITSLGSSPSLTPRKSRSNSLRRHKSGSMNRLRRQMDQEDQDEPLTLWDMIGEEALQEQPYTCNVVATSKLTCAVLQLDDYHAAMSATKGETFESLKVIHLMLMNRAQRTPKQLQELADHLGVFTLFKNMELSARMEVCNLVEYIYCPAGFTLFEEGDRIDFCYLIMHGQVAFTKYDEKTKKVEDLGTKGTGDHFGTLMTLSAGEKKRPFTAVAVEETELAVISRVGYNRILKKQLHGAIQARVELLRGLAVMRSNSTAALQRVATLCQDEVYPPGCVVVDPTSPPNRIFFIMEGEAKLVWITEQLTKLPEDQQIGKSDTSLSAVDAVTNAAAEKAEKAAKETAMAVAQQLGPNSFGTVSRIAVGKRRHMVELARLATGDVLNGAALVGLNPLFHVVAVTHLKLLSLETDNVESCIGRESWRMLCDLVRSQHSWAKQHLQQVVDVRQGLGKQIMDAAIRRNMQDKDLCNFMDHFIPSGVTDQAQAIAQLAEEASMLHQSSVQPLRLNNFDEVLRLPTIIIKPGSLHGIPNNHAMVQIRPTKALLHGAKRQAAGDLGQLPGQTSLTSLTNQASYASLPAQSSYASIGGSALGAQPSYASSVGLGGAALPAQASSASLVSITATNAAELAGIGSNHRHHLGTTVGANLRKKKSRHMAFAGGVATAILDQATEPVLTASMMVTRQRQEAVQKLHRQHMPGVQSSWMSCDTRGCMEEASQPRLDMGPAGHSCIHVSSSDVSGVAASQDHAQADAQHAQQRASDGAQMPGNQTGSVVGSYRSSRLSGTVGDVSPNGLTAEPSSQTIQGHVDHVGHYEALDREVQDILQVEQHHAPLGGSTQGVVGWSPAQGSQSVLPGALNHPVALLARNAPPVVTSPMLNQKMMVRRATSPKTAAYSQKRAAVILSATLNPDGSIQDMDGVTNPNPSLRPGRHTADAVLTDRTALGQPNAPASPGAQAGMKDSESPVMILPTMMNVYQSVLTSDKPLPPIVTHKHKSSSSPGSHWAVTSRQDPGITRVLPVLPRTTSRAAALRSRMQRSSSSGDDDDGVVRIIAATRDHEPVLPLDFDQAAPPLDDHELADPTLQDISYILHRWGNQWADKRDAQLRARLAAQSPEPRPDHELLLGDGTAPDLEDFGAPAFKPRS